MNQSLHSDSLTAEIAGPGPWPANTRLFQPFELEQVVLPDAANCLAASAFLSMAGLPYTREERSNAEDMSPSGQVPFIKAGSFLVADLERIITFAGYKKVSLTGHLTEAQRSDMRAYMSLVSIVLGSAELYVSWHHQPTYEEVTAPRYGSPHPWPLSKLLPVARQRKVARRLQHLGWADKPLGAVYGEVERCCLALSQRLGQQTYFFGDKPTQLDALVFGHLFTLITTNLPHLKLSELATKHTNLVRLCKHVDREFFNADRLASPLAVQRPLSEETSQQEVQDSTLDASVSRKSSSEKSGSNGEYDKLDEISQHSHC